LETLLLFVCIEFKVKVTDDKTDICLLRYTLTGLAQAEIFMEIAWMYYGQGKAIYFLQWKTELWEFLEGW